MAENKRNENVKNWLTDQSQSSELLDAVPEPEDKWRDLGDYTPVRDLKSPKRVWPETPSARYTTATTQGSENTINLDIPARSPTSPTPKSASISNRVQSPKRPYRRAAFSHFNSHDNNLLGETPLSPQYIDVSPMEKDTVHTPALKYSRGRFRLGSRSSRPVRDALKDAQKDSPKHEMSAKPESSVQEARPTPLEKQLRADPFFAPRYVPNRPPHTQQDHEYMIEKIQVEAYDRLWMERYESVKARQAGKYDPIKCKREPAYYDPVQEARGTVQWSIDQMFECYMGLLDTEEEMKHYLGLLETERKIEEMETDMQRVAVSMQFYGLEQPVQAQPVHRRNGKSKHELELEVNEKLQKLRVRKTLLKRAGEGHLWDVAKTDDKFKWVGKMLQGILEMRKCFEAFEAPCTDEELQHHGYTGIRNDAL